MTGELCEKLGCSTKFPDFGRSMIKNMNIWAHRGCSYRFPENTLSSFREACRYDITGIELDIQLSKDGELVVIHDETVDRTTDGTGRVCDMTVRELKNLKIVPNNNTGLPYETIPTMYEVFEVLAPECRKWGLYINIELKNSNIRYDGMEEKILALVKEFEVEPYIIYSSFLPDSVKLLKELDPEVKTGILCPSLKNCFQISQKINVDALHPYINQVDMKDIAEVTNLPVRAWNIMQFEPFFPEDREIVMQDLDEIALLGVTDIFTNVPERYACRRIKKDQTVIQFDMFKKVNPEIGYVENTEEYIASTVHFYKAEEGSLIRWKNKDYCYQIYLYSMDTEPDLIYTYCYQKEENWAAYRPDWSNLTWQRKDWLFTEECYFRISVKHVNGQSLPVDMNENNIFEYSETASGPYIWPSYFRLEADLTVEAVKLQREEGNLTFLLLTDSHYVNNGTWDDTAYNLKRTAKLVSPDAVVHLGDITDGLVPLDLTKEYVKLVMRDLKETGAPVYLCLGNHDSNYFWNNPEKMTEEEMGHFYLKKDKLYYYVDYPEQQLRVLFLYSFDYREEVRYGFPVEELEWARKVLNELNAGWSVLVFSHVPPLSKIHFWSDAIRNGEELIEILEEYHAREGCRILALIHGHNHAEQIYRERAFPIISIGCNKLEDFKDKKPEGSYTVDRKRNTVTQDLWDVLIVSTKNRSLKFIRFGAGDDRIVVC